MEEKNKLKFDEVIPKKTAALEIIKRIKMQRITIIISVAAIFIVQMLNIYGSMPGAIMTGVLTIIFALTILKDKKEEERLKQNYNIQ